MHVKACSVDLEAINLIVKGSITQGARKQPPIVESGYSSRNIGEASSILSQVREMSPEHAI